MEIRPTNCSSATAHRWVAANLDDFPAERLAPYGIQARATLGEGGRTTKSNWVHSIEVGRGYGGTP
jgi:hypothetical protein